MDDRQGGTFTTTTQTNPEEQNVVNNSNEECGESGEGVEENEEERMFDGCGVEKIMEEIETPHKVELSQELPYTVDDEKVMMVAEKNEGLLDKEMSIEQKREIENKAEIDRVIDEICALFNKKELGRIWTPQHLYLKFMEF
ncbi:resistance protein, partial [Trifolium medium]|nr:resistance protein [Trifolium medium]